MTYPAPDILEDDPWFGPAPETERSIAIKEAQEHLVQEQILLPEDSPKVKEADNIHQLMYEIATSSVPTSLALNPLPSIGGSEEFQEGWMSGCGGHF